MKKNVLDNFNISNCCGCGACIDICPCNALNYDKDLYGFTIPQLDFDKCVKCKKCLSVCPFVETNTLFNELPNKVYAATNKNDRVLMNSSSGGVFYEIAKYILDQNGIVYGCTMSDKYLVYHICVSSMDDLKIIQRSKYVQSRLKGIYNDLYNSLLNGKMVLFVGTPCQVAAVKKVCKNIDCSNLYLVDIVCHGVPSNDLFVDYINELIKENKTIHDYIFRAKRKPKNGMNSYFSYKKNNKTIIKNWPEDSFNFLYEEALIYRNSCYSCPFATQKRVSDITICDFWKWEKFHLDSFKKNTSVSGIVINSAKGKKIINSIISDFLYCESSYDFLATYNSSLRFPVSVDMKKREKILNLWKNNGYSSIENWFKNKYMRQILRASIIRKTPDIILSVIRRIKNGY